jgi:hypothetical protein
MPPAPMIAISNPPSGATVNRPFPADGTYVFSPGLPPISVVLKDSTGTVVAVGAVTVGTGTWSAQLSPTQALTGATVVAEITGTPATDSTTNITVN